MGETVANFKSHKDLKEKELLDKLDFTNNTYVWARCKHCGELVMSKITGYSDEIICSNCKNTLYTYMREATKKEIVKYMIKNKINSI